MSLRRHVRLRQEYLYRKSLEGKEREAFDQRKRLKEAIARGVAVSEVDREHAQKRLREEDAVDAHTDGLRTHIDDEYANAGYDDPKVCVTTSRDPSSRLKQFVKEVRLLFPNSHRVNRGGHKLTELVEACRSAGFTDMVMVQEHRGEPDTMIISHLPYGPTVTFTLSNCVMRHDIENCGTVSEAYPHLIFHEFTSSLGERIQNVLKHLFPPSPKPDTKRVMTFYNKQDFISFRHHVYEKSEESHKDVILKEVGPRFEMKPYEIKLGTLDHPNAEKEWVLHSYMNTSKKQKLLSDK